MSAQKVVCDLVSFLSLSLDDGSFECQDVPHLESLCPASEVSDLNFTSERTAVSFPKANPVFIHAALRGAT